MPAVSEAQMNTAWWESAGSYKRLEERSVAGEKVTAWISPEAACDFWDSFLQSIPTGQFQQSTIWAKAKSIDGWACIRVLIASEARLLGGFQLLWRSSRYGRIGYVSKGPVLVPGTGSLDAYAAGLLRTVARREKLRALIVQPPDGGANLSGALETGGFLPNVLMGVNDATWMIDLRNGFEPVEKAMDKVSRRRVRQGLESGLQVREGGRADLEKFFELMLLTCQRQKVAPSPPELRHFQAIWDAAHPTGNIRLYFLEHEGQWVAGQILLLFGRTVTFWKKGWAPTPNDKRLNPNDVSMYVGMQWGSQNGYDVCDFCSFSRPMARTLLHGGKLSEADLQSRFMFFVRFGGNPVLLPPAQIYIPNRALRMAYSLYFRRSIRGGPDRSAHQKEVSDY